MVNICHTLSYNKTHKINAPYKAQIKHKNKMLQTHKNTRYKKTIFPKISKKTLHNKHTT